LEKKYANQISSQTNANRGQRATETGKDRTGQERTGKDRKGQERTGKDRKG
jgi:hypothetical protein